MEYKFDPTYFCVLDYETRSIADLPKTGAIEYAKHESTSIFCIAYKIGDGSIKLWIPERAPMPKELWHAFKHGVLVAHNAGFERAITKHVLSRYELLTKEQREWLKVIPISRWKCTAAKAAASSLPRALGDACAVMQLPTQKDMIGNKLIKKYSKPRKPSKNNPSIWWTNRNDLRGIYRYCIVDVKAEHELDQALPDLTIDEQKVWELDQLINERGALIDVPTVKLFIKLIAEEKLTIKKAVQKLSGGEVENATQQAKVLEWVNERGARMRNLQAQTIRDYLEGDNVPPKVRQMLEYRQAASKTSVSKFNSMLKNVGDDDRARELLLYCGADRSGRWSGKRVQPQNFPRPTPHMVKLGFNMDETVEAIKKHGLQWVRDKFGPTKVMEVLGACTRGMIIAPDGDELFCADLASIEARLAFWFADEKDGLEAFEQGRKLYEEMASDTFGIPIEKIGKESLERFVGKESILGCQYGMGAKKFLEQCFKKDMKMVTPEIAQRAVSAYRKKYSTIQDAWGDLERCFIQAVKNPGEVYHTTKVSMRMEEKFLVIRLPSGRKLRYFKPTVSLVKKWGKDVPEIRFWSKGWMLNPETGKPKKGWTQVKAWGGILFNHIVQGTARDLMVLGIKRIEKAQYTFMLSIHDEGLSSMKKGCGSLEEYLHLFAGKRPKWGLDIPLKADGWVGQRYRK